LESVAVIGGFFPGQNGGFTTKTLNGGKRRRTSERAGKIGEKRKRA